MTCLICSASFLLVSARDEPGHDCVCGRNLSRRAWRDSDIPMREIQRDRVAWELFCETGRNDPRLVEAR